MIQIHVVDPLADLITVWVEIGISVALGRGVRIVQMGHELAAWRSEISGIESIVLIEMVLEANEDRLTVLGIDHWTREDAVEPPNSAFRQVPLASNVVGWYYLVAVRVDRK